MSCKYLKTEDIFFSSVKKMHLINKHVAGEVAINSENGLPINVTEGNIGWLL